MSVHQRYLNEHLLATAVKHERNADRMLERAYRPENTPQQTEFWVERAATTYRLAEEARASVK